MTPEVAAGFVLEQRRGSEEADAALAAYARMRGAGAREPAASPSPATGRGICA